MPGEVSLLKWSLLLQQTFFRAGAIFLVKFIGLIGRVSLTRMVGAEGVGLYQVAYSFYGFVLILITGGLPTALALFTAKHTSHGWTWFKILSLFYSRIRRGVKFSCFSLLGLVCTASRTP